MPISPDADTAAERVGIYNSWDSDPAINQYTDFFGAASLVVAWLQPTDLLPLPAYQWISDLGDRLYEFNFTNRNLILSGTLNGVTNIGTDPGARNRANKEMVRLEQTFVQSELDQLRLIDPTLYGQVVGKG